VFSIDCSCSLGISLIIGSIIRFNPNGTSRERVTDLHSTIAPSSASAMFQ